MHRPVASFPGTRRTLGLAVCIKWPEKESERIKSHQHTTAQPGKKTETERDIIKSLKMPTCPLPKHEKQAEFEEHLCDTGCSGQAIARVGGRKG